ncbi:glycosyltransferase family 4 protein [Spirosoma validum]|uniref:Glycosyltransferase family 4 protein n=1 Tax=Spirosoma validum TaxID=2771355 RepID=A0A927GBQ4_9BACT|nr:glycosyltransferase family 1 protein [Spirosoma validum]MBD2751868.1 glycosyltransferase family 4 protein [Spirosoma validum]
MNIFFDHQTFTLQNYGGISRYFCELIKGINNTDDNNAHLSLLWSNNVHLKEYNIPVIPYPFSKKRRLYYKSNTLFNCIDNKIKSYDIYHATYFDDFLVSSIGQKPFVTTFYDMTYERLSNRFAELSADKTIFAQKQKVVQKASHLIAISESTKLDMIEMLDVLPEKITVIHLGSPFVQHDATNKNENSAPNASPYLLYVGNRSSYKNFIPFLRAVAQILIKYRVKLVCAGGGEFSPKEIEVIKSWNLNNLIEYKDVNDKILQGLYKGAIAFVFPSLYEGFGIPVLEAFSCNCPCVLSNISSLPEVAGDAALYFDPDNKDSMEASVEKILLDSALRAKLIQLGREQLSLFSWQKTVNSTLDLYNKLH